MRPYAFVPAVVAVLLAAAPAAQAKRVKDLWATVNVCDTQRSPNDMGVRARAPGDGTRAQIYMRFTAQYHIGGRWATVSGKGRSHWLRAGSARFLNQELGYTFSFDAPKPGASYLMRGLVQYQWRDHRKGHRRRVVVRRTRRYTEGGHPTKPSDPRGFSAARCRISTPKPPASGN